MRRDPDEILARHAPGSTVPHTLHQVFFGGALPERLAAAVQDVRDVNPGWDHQLYDDARAAAYVRSHYGPEVAAYLDRIDPRYAAAKSDLFRYLLLYREGGVYLDVKSATTRPLDDVLRSDDTYLVSQWENATDSFLGFGVHDELVEVPGGEYQQWWLASAPGHPFLRAAVVHAMRCLDRYRVLGTGVGRHGVLRTTGPIAYTVAVSAVLDQHPHRRVESEREVGLVYSVLPGLAHARMDGEHYSRQWRPVVRVPGPWGVLNDVLARGQKSYYVVDWRVRRLLGLGARPGG